MRNQYALTPERLLDERIRIEQLSIGAGCVGSTFCAFVYAYIANSSPGSIFNPELLVYWLAFQVLLLAVWFLFQFIYRRNVSQVRHYWKAISSITGALYALTWSSTWFFFVNVDHTAVFVSWLYLLVNIGAGGILATVFHLPSAVLLVLFLFVPVLIDVAIHVEQYDRWILYILFFTPIGGVMFSFILNRFIIDAVEQREKNYLLAEQIQKEKQQVEKISKEKTRFLAAASHDLRQPIQAIRLFEHILKNRLKDPEEQAILANLEQSTDSLASLLDSLLDISKLDAGIIQIKKRPFVVDQVLFSLTEQLNQLAALNGISLHYVPSSMTVESDPVQLERIVRNLLLNAIKHMGKGKILIGVRRANSSIVILDDGIGIPAAEQEKIFDEFYQLNNPERNRSKGLGLGLAIVERTATLLGHEIELVSAINRGSQFSIKLSMIKQIGIDSLVVPRQTDHQQKLAEPAVRSVADNKAHTILVVEDDREVLYGLGALLDDWGYTALLASNKDDALRIAQRKEIHLILSDYQLQNHGNGNDSGVDVIEAIRHHRRADLPAILLTGNTDPVVLKRLSHHDFPILHKPCIPEQLAAELGRLL